MISHMVCTIRTRVDMKLLGTKQGTLALQALSISTRPEDIGRNFSIINIDKHIIIKLVHKYVPANKILLHGVWTCCTHAGPFS